MLVFEAARLSRLAAGRSKYSLRGVIAVVGIRRRRRRLLLAGKTVRMPIMLVARLRRGLRLHCMGGQSSERQPGEQQACELWTK